ncbi:VCBS repeat-containing protein [Pseudoalteromonas luteoviolacea]|uniref:VCBS repeat-containing protein n=1 Tax=Pseudoalteromonas luteoviolacea TaxID=43657 RepID=UPI001F180E69|nr:VCBS repeat-containing protein [Pseudoalteromonas luteoviolacea]MCF6442277.1 VCBS repeat-containing protein [Pseudoalteromonas luteoviolacea]
MKKFKHSSIAIALSIVLSGCGGGSSDSQSTENVASETLSNSKDKTFSELDTAANSLVQSRYTGQESKAEISPELVQQAFVYMLDDSASSFTDFDFPGIQSHVKSDGTISGTERCASGGSVNYSGSASESGSGVISAKFTNCSNYSDTNISGNITVKISVDTNQLGIYFDALQMSSQGKSQKLTGSLNAAQSDLNAHVGSVSITQNILLEDHNGDQIVSKMRINGSSDRNWDDGLNMSGSIMFNDSGILTVDAKDLTGYAPSYDSGEIKFTGKNSSATISFSDSFPTYYLDSDLDNENDLGTYITNINEFIYGTQTDINPVPIDAMSLPPKVGNPFNLVYMPDTTMPIIVEAGYYSDEDTAIEDLVVSFEWYVNDELVEGEYTNTLPAGVAVFGDVLEVAMRVSDGANSVLSYRTSITLEDAPNYVEVTGLPDTISADQRVVFTAKVVDPDNKSAAQTGTLIASPEGATVDENGQITWNTPSEMLFSSQDYFFTFATGDESNPSETAIKVTVNSQKSLPIARSGVEVPKIQNNFIIDDFDGDKKNEILTTDNSNRVMLITYNNETPEQKWLYPYSLAEYSTIKSIFAANTDEDPEKEIYVLTGEGLSVIDDLNSEARTLLKFEKEAVFGAFRDINNDGVPELAVLLQHEDSYYSAKTLAVYSFEKPDEPLFETVLNIANTVSFGNVDTDENVELIVNSGLVYDTATWENQWLSSNEFGENNFIIADINGDGVDEIIGDKNGVTVYSAVDKAQLASLDIYNNNCKIAAANLDNDASDELIVGSCQWGKLHAYKYDSENALTELWNADAIDNDTASFQVGDSDNDGKLEIVWGTGIYDSGADKLVTADINSESVSVRQDQIAPQLDSFVTAGWAKGAGNIEKAIFYVPNSNSGYDGGRVVQMDENGAFTPSDEISTNWNDDKAAITADFNNDGLTELLLPNTALYSTALGVMDLATYDISYELPIDSNDRLVGVDAADINGDNIPDAIYSTQNYVKVVDVNNQTLLSSFVVSGPIKDFSLTENDALNMLVASDELTLLSFSNGGFSEKSKLDQRCVQVEYFNFDSDAELEVACLYNEDEYYSDSDLSLIVYEVNGDEFEQVHKKALNENVIDFTVSPTNKNHQQLIFATQSGDSWSNSSYSNVLFTDSFGNKISRSPDLLGRPSKDALKVRLDEKGKLNLLLSTSSAMYQVH